MPIQGYGFGADMSSAAGAGQPFSGTLDAAGELAIVGTNLDTLKPNAEYTSLPPDVNNTLYFTRNSAISVTLKNTGGAANAGATVEGSFS